jgi:hypothetical protein
MRARFVVSNLVREGVGQRADDWLLGTDDGRALVEAVAQRHIDPYTAAARAEVRTAMA